MTHDEFMENHRKALNAYQLSIKLAAACSDLELTADRWNTAIHLSPLQQTLSDIIDRHDLRLRQEEEARAIAIEQMAAMASSDAGFNS